MSFNEQLNIYISTLNCSAKELAKSSSLSASIISKYRSGDRVPAVNSEQLKKIAIGLSNLATIKGINEISLENILSTLTACLTEDSINYTLLSKNLDTLITVLNINVSEMARSLNFDASYLSRIRNGKRRPSNPDDFLNSICNYVSHKYVSESDKKAISHLVGSSLEEISNINAYFSKLRNWFLVENLSTKSYIDHFLKSLDEFKLDEYIHAIHFDDLKVPSVPFHFVNSKNYYGLDGMKKGELDFFKATVLSKSKVSVFMCGDMPMEDMAEDLEFGKKWMFAIAMMLKKGLHLNIIHDIDRPFNEMMLGLESWIPIYMTGQISPYYLKNASSNTYCHLNYVSGSVALTGECIRDFHEKGKYYLTNSKEYLAYYTKKADCLLSKAKPLMEIYRKDTKNIFNAKYANNIESGNRHRILSNLPLFTITDTLLDEILKNNKIAEDEQKLIKQYVEQERDTFNSLLNSNLVFDEVPQISEEDFKKYPMSLALSGMFIEKNINYTYDQYLKHLNITKDYTKNEKHYSLQINNKSIFRNIQIDIIEDNYIIISKNSDPVIHFVIHHPKLCSAIESFVLPVIE